MYIIKLCFDFQVLKNLNLDFIKSESRCQRYCMLNTKTVLNNPPHLRDASEGVRQDSLAGCLSQEQFLYIPLAVLSVFAEMHQSRSKLAKLLE